MTKVIKDDKRRQSNAAKAANFLIINLRAILIKIFQLIISPKFRRNLMSLITALLPAYNEEVSIGSVVLRTRQFADRVIVVDDGSSDRTAEVAALAGAEVLRHPQNRGKGAALKTGFESLNGDSVIVTIDTDGQHDPADIPRLVAADSPGRSRHGQRQPLPEWRQEGHAPLPPGRAEGSGHRHQL